MDHIGLPHCYLEYPGTGHVGYLTSDPLNALNFVFNFLASVVCGESPNCTSATAAVSEAATAGNVLRSWPTPAKDMLSIELPEAARVQFIDAQGRTVLSHNLPAGTTTLDVAHLPEGLYVVKATGANVRTSRIVVAR